MKIDLRDMTATQLKELARTSILSKDTSMLRKLQHEAQRRLDAHGIEFTSTPEGQARARKYLREGAR